MEKYKKMLPYLFVNAIAFYMLPLLIRDIGSGMLILLLGIPLICLGAAAVYGAKNQVSWLYCVLTGLLFAPTIWIFYNESAAVYALIYGGLSLAGSFLGSLWGKRT